MLNVLIFQVVHGLVCTTLDKTTEQQKHLYYVIVVLVNLVTFYSIQNMKLSFDKLYTKDEENGVYMVHDTSIEFNVQYLNTTTNRFIFFP